MRPHERTGVTETMQGAKVNESDGVPLRAYMRVVWRWKWVIGLLALLGVAAGILYWQFTDPSYSASAQIIYEAQIDIGDPLNPGYSNYSQRVSDLETVPSVVGSAEVGTLAQDILGEDFPTWTYSVTADLDPGVDNTYSNVVAMRATGPAAKGASRVANAFAEAFIAWRRTAAQGQVEEAIKAVRNRLTEYETPVERQSAEYTTLVQRLQDLEILKASVTGNFKLITAAGVPSEPVAPDPVRSIGIGLALGLLGGVILTFVLEQLDTKIVEESQVTQVFDLPVLGRIPPMRRSNGDSTLLLTLGEPDGTVAEAFRLLRSNLDFMSVDAKIRTLLITSSLQREGKSISCCNLAVSMALAGKKVVLIDGDLRSPHIHSYLGLGNAVGLSSVISRQAGLRDALFGLSFTTCRPGSAEGMSRGIPTGVSRTQVRVRRTPDADGPITLWDTEEDAPTLFVLPGGPVPPNPGEMVSSARFGDIIKEVSAQADMVVVDAPAMLVVGDTAAIAAKVDGLVYVVDPKLVRRPVLVEAVRQFDQMACRKLGLVLTNSKPSRGSYRYRYRYYSRSGSGGADTVSSD